MKFIIAAAIIFGIFGLALATAPSQAAPTLPSQCPGVIGDYNILAPAMTIDLDFGDGPLPVGLYSGTEDADLIIVDVAGGGVVSGEGGNDCIVIVDGAYAAVVDGGSGNDVIVTQVNPLYAAADGGDGTDLCVGFAFDANCELH